MGLQGMLMWTWDYRGFAIGPVLTPLASIFVQKNSVFFQKNDFFDILINRPIWPIFMKKSQGKSCLPIFASFRKYKPYLSRQFSPNSIFDITPPKTAIFEKSIFDVFVKISRLWVKIRNFWVPKKTSDPHLYTLQI